MRRITVLPAVVTILVSVPTVAQTPIEVSTEPQFFVDALLFSESANIALRLHPARKTGEHNLERDRPWESATLNWFTVMADDAYTVTPGAKYRMWYECYDIEGWPTGDDTSFCYAESADGIHWVKPKLSLFEYQGEKTNNILFRMLGPEQAHSRVHGTGVFRDPSAPRDARYKAVSQGVFSSVGKPPHRIAGMHSADGLHWTRYPSPICNVFADSQFSAFWDTASEAYVLYGRVAGHGRAIGRSTSTDFSRFPPLELVLDNADDEPPNSDLYNPPVLRYEDLYLMFPSLFRHDTQTLDIRLAVSRDGIHWTWPDGDTPFIPLGQPGEFDSGSLYMGQGMIPADNGETWLYYGGSRLKHDESELERLVKPGNSRVYSRVVTRLDRLVSVDAGDKMGHFVTPPLSFRGNALVLDAEVLEGGRVRVGMLREDGTPIKGRAVVECVPIRRERRDQIVRWVVPNSGITTTADGGLLHYDGFAFSYDVGEYADQAVRLRVEMTNASLYSFVFQTLTARPRGTQPSSR